MGIIRFVKDWTLLCSLIVGSIIYLLFSRVEPLVPVGDFMGPKLVGLMPYVIFCMLYLTFCKIDMHNFRHANGILHCKASGCCLPPS